MKVFEVITEHCENDSNEIITTREYVTATDNELLTVTKYFTQHCFEYEKNLMSVREVLVIVENIE